MDNDLFYQFCRLDNWTHQPKNAIPETDATPLQSWVQWQLRRPVPPTLLQALPPAAAQIWLAWQHYHQGEYLQAHELFTQCWQDVVGKVGNAEHSAIAIDCALGLARLYTRCGNWRSARRFGLFALHHSRLTQRLFDISRSYNVLGDLFCRAGELQWAHVCLTTSTQMLPQGSIHKARHINSLATVLLRQGQFERAEPLLMSSLYLARDTADHDSFWHALARLQFLYNAKAPTQQARMIFAAMLPQKTTPIAQAYLELAEAYSSLISSTNARLKIEQALLLLSAFPMEAAWCKHLLGLPQQAELNQILHWQTAVLPDEPVAVTDAVFLNFPLGDAQMHWLQVNDNEKSLDNFLQQKTCFFI